MMMMMMMIIFIYPRSMFITQGACGAEHLWRVPLNTEVFCVVYDYLGKEDLNKGYKNPKGKLGVTTHFSEIIK